MQYRYSKNDFISLLDEVLNEEDQSRIKEFLKLAEEQHFYAPVGVQKDSDRMGEIEFFDYLYCLFRTCDFQTDKFLLCLKVQYPIEVIFQDGGISMEKSAFERIVSIRFNQTNAKQILSECDYLANQSRPESIPSLYGGFYALLFVCNFNKETFLQNLAQKHGLKPYNKDRNEDELNSIIRTSNTFQEVYHIEKQIRSEIDKRMSDDAYQASIKFHDGYDEDKKYFKPWAQDILDAVSKPDFSEKLAWLIFEVFPESTREEYEERVKCEIDLLNNYQEISKFGGISNIAKVTVDYLAGTGQKTKFKQTTPTLLHNFSNYLADYYRLLEGIKLDATGEYEDEIEQMSVMIETRLIRRTALLLCHFGLYEKSDRSDFDMKFIYNGQINYVKFGAKYGGLMFNLLKSIEKCEKVLFAFDRKGKNTKKDYGVNPRSNIEKWKVLKYRLQKDYNWITSEISVDQIGHIPYSLKLFQK